MDSTCSRIWQVLILTTITLLSRGQPSGCLCVETVTHTSAMQVRHDADLSFNYPLRYLPISIVGDARLHKGYPDYSVVYL